MINILKTALSAGRRLLESVQGLAVESDALRPNSDTGSSQGN